MSTDQELISALRFHGEGAGCGACNEAADRIETLRTELVGTQKALAFEESCCNVCRRRLARFEAALDRLDDMTAAEMIEIVHRLDYASTQMLSYLSPGGYCCESPTPLRGYCTHSVCASLQEIWSWAWGAAAAHNAGVLLDFFDQGRKDRG